MGFSLLHGLAFAIFYTLLRLPIGRMADHRKRTNIMAIGVALWSIMTCLCGFARNFGQMFMARVGVGVGGSSAIQSQAPCGMASLHGYPLTTSAPMAGPQPKWRR